MPKQGKWEEIMEIKHLTFNSGELRISKPEEVSKDMYPILSDIVKNAKTPEGGEVMDGTFLKMTVKGSAYVATLFGSGNIPILITTGIKHKLDANYVWNTLKSKMTEEEMERLRSCIQTEPPCIIDVICPSAFMFMDALHWTGDFTKCLGWFMLFPEEIR